MKKNIFSGFPDRVEVTPIPNLFFTVAMSQIKDLTELKVVLHIFWKLSRRRGYPRFITYNELLSDNVLIDNIGEGEKTRDTVLRRALDLAVRHNIITYLKIDDSGEFDDAYFINTETERKTVDRIKRGEISLPGLMPKKQEKSVDVLPLNIFNLYEQNIGMLTPLIAEQLREAEKLYQADWIESAFREAVSLNKRNWKYILRILERWSAEGKDNGKSGRDFKEGKDSDKYLKGRYGHMVER